MEYIRDIIAVEFMEAAVRENAIWIIHFAEIEQLTARE